MLPHVNETHTRVTTIRLDKIDLHRIIVLGLKADGVEVPSGSPVEIKFEDQTEGSPSYKTGTKAVVTIVEDLLNRKKR